MFTDIKMFSTLDKIYLDEFFFHLGRTLDNNIYLDEIRDKSYCVDNLNSGHRRKL